MRQVFGNPFHVRRLEKLAANCWNDRIRNYRGFLTPPTFLISFKIKVQTDIQKEHILMPMLFHVFALNLKLKSDYGHITLSNPFPNGVWLFRSNTPSLFIPSVLHSAFPSSLPPPICTSLLHPIQFTLLMFGKNIITQPSCNGL